MSEVLEQIRLLVEWTITGLGYPGITLVMIVENLFPPIPSEVVLPFAGFLASEGEFSFLGVLVSSTLGALIGALIIYDIGRRVSEARLRWFFRHYGKWFLLSEDDLGRSLQLFRRHDATVVFFARFLPGVRSLISLPAGMAGMPLGKFLAFTTLAVLIWNGVLSFVGYLLGRNWQAVLAFVDNYELVIYALLSGLVAVFVVRRLWRSLRPG